VQAAKRDKLGSLLVLQTGWFLHLHVPSDERPLSPTNFGASIYAQDPYFYLHNSTVSVASLTHER
jgi:hypothetical protein